MIPRALQERLRIKQAPGLPTQVHLQVTDRCFLPCKHCDIYKNKTPDLPTDVWEKVLDELGSWLGPASLNFVGGETLLRKDLESLMRRATRLGFTVTFNTNAWLLTPARARALCDAGVSIAYLSLDGARPETVDHSRGRAGTWQKIMDACDALDALPQPRVIFSCILHAQNAAEIPDLLALTKQRGYELVLQPLYQNFGDNAHEPDWWLRSPFWPSNAQLPAIDAAIDTLIAERRQWGKVCNTVSQLEAFRQYFHNPSADNGLACKAGHSDIAFDAHGNVRLCYFLEPVGNVREGVPLAEIWGRYQTLRRRYEVSRCPRTCNLLNCNFDGP